MSQTDSPLGTAPVGKLVLQLAIPAMLAQFVNILYSVVDRSTSATLQARAMRHWRVSVCARLW